MGRHMYCENIDIVHTGGSQRLFKITHIPTAALLALDLPNK